MSVTQGEIGGGSESGGAFGATRTGIKKFETRVQSQNSGLKDSPRPRTLRHLSIRSRGRRKKMWSSRTEKGGGAISPVDRCRSQVQTHVPVLGAVGGGRVAVQSCRCSVQKERKNAGRGTWDVGTAETQHSVERLIDAKARRTRPQVEGNHKLWISDQSRGVPDVISSRWAIFFIFR